MTRKKRPPQAGPKLPMEVIRAILGWRSSNAAGKHGKNRKATRGNDKRKAIKESSE